MKSIRLAGPVRTWQAVRYTFLKRRQEAGRCRPAGPVLHPGALLSIEPARAGACFRFQNAGLEIHFLAEDLACIAWSPGLTAAPYALAKAAWPEVNLTISEGDAGWRLESSELKVHLGLDGSLLFLDAQGQPLREDLPPVRQGVELTSLEWTARSQLRPEECLYGLGLQAGRLNLRGTVHRMWNRDPTVGYGPGDDPLYLSIPVILGLHQGGSYLVFYENPHPATIQLGAPDQGRPDLFRAHFEGGACRYYFIPGPPERSLERYAELTGRPPLPPRWALGYHQSRWGYRSQEDIRRVVAGFKTNRLALSAIHLDIDYMERHQVFSVDRRRFPDLHQLADELLEAGIRLVTIIDPPIRAGENNPLYEQGLAREVFCRLPGGRIATGPAWAGWCAFPDFSASHARRWWGEQYTGLVEAGVSGFWHDKNEPFVFSAFGDPSLPANTCHDLDGQGGDHLAAHNLYGLLENKAAYEGLREPRPGRRPWLLSRSGWAGSQRYAWNWTGDLDSSWEGLRQTIPTVLGMGLSGLAFSGPDVGGFSGNPSAELYLRWFQMAAFLPFFRTHSSALTRPREPWLFGEPYLGILRQYLELRDKFLPYLYTLAWEAAQTGHPLARPLFWKDPQQAGLWEVDDAFLLGDDLLIAPALERDCQTREVCLPPGSWFSLWEAERFDGPGRVRLPVTLERIPVLVRAGSILPMAGDDGLTLHVYPPGKPGAFSSILYNDAGDGFPSEPEGWRLDRFSLEETPGRFTLNHTVDGLYHWPYASTSVDVHGFPPFKVVKVDGIVAHSMHPIAVDGGFHSIEFELSTSHLMIRHADER